LSIICREKGEVARGGETYSEGTGTPWGTTADLLKLSENAESALVTQRNVDHSVVGKGRYGVQGSDFLPTALSTSGDENANVFACDIIRKRIIKNLTQVGKVGTIIPLSPPLCQRPPVVSMNAFHWPGKLPKRVGIPKRKASNLDNSAAVITGYAGFGGACMSVRTASGRVSGTL